MRKVDDALRSRLGLWICSPITSHRFRPPLTTKLRLLAVATATLRAACRFDRLPFDFAQGLSLSNGKARSPSAMSAGSNGLPRGGRRCRSAPFPAQKLRCQVSSLATRVKAASLPPVSTITAILEPHADGSLHLPLPVELQHRRVRVEVTLEAADESESTPRLATPEMLGQRREALAALRALGGLKDVIPDPAAWQREQRGQILR